MFPYKFYFMSVDMKAEVKKEGQEYRLSIDTPYYSGSHVFRTREQALSEMIMDHVRYLPGAFCPLRWFVMRL